VDRLTGAIRGALKKKGGEVEEIRFEGGEWKLDQLLSEFNSFSMFASHRFLRIQEAERIKKDEWGRVAAALKEIPSGLTLLFVTQKKETFREASRAFGDEAADVECLRPKPRELPMLAASLAKEEGKVLGAAEARLLIDLVGTDLLTLKNQISLLSLFVGERRSVTAEDIQKLFLETADKEVFALTRALSEGDQAQAFTLLRHLLHQGEAPIKLLALLTRHYRLVFKAKLLLKKGQGSHAMASSLKLPPFVVEQYLDQAQTLPWKKAIKIFQELFRTDRALKSSPLPPGTHLEKFLWNCFL
jgi:DNA polymerase-3 subunit delta